jgi:hypothetical protein
MARSAAGNGSTSTASIEHSEKPDGAAPADASAPAGRIIHDERGNAVWNWAKEGSEASIGSTSQMLKKLQLTDLRVEGEAPTTKEEPEAKRRESGYGPGYNPYDRTAPVRKPPAPKKAP